MDEPPYTCGIMDKVDDAYTKATHFISIMQDLADDLRNANAKLREWGQHWEAKCEELQTELDCVKEELLHLKNNS